MNQYQIEEFRRRARAKGIGEQDIASYVARSMQQSARTTANQSIRQSSSPAQSTSGPQVLSQQSQTGQTGGSFAGNFFKALIEPAQKYTGFVAETVRAATTPGMIKSAMGQELTPQEQEAVANYQPRFVREDQIDTRGDIIKTGVKAGAGGASYFIPGGSTAKTLLASRALSGALYGVSEGDDINAGNIVMGAAGDIAGGAVGDAALKIAKPLLRNSNRAFNKFLNPFASQFDDDVAKLATEKGVELPLSAKTSSNFVKQVEALAQKSMFGGGITQKVITARNQITQLAKDLTDRIAKDVDKKNLGQIVKNGFEKFEANFNQTKTVLYDAVPATVKTAPAILENTKAVLERIIAGKGKSLVSNNADFYEGLLKKLGTGEGGTYQNILQTRSEIGNRIKNFNDPIATGDKGAMKTLYAALSDDLEDTIRNVDEQAYQVFEQANAFYRDNIQKINSKIGRQIKNADPEKLLDNLIKPNSETTVEMVKEVIGEEGVRELQEGFVAKLFKESVHSSKGTVDLSKLRTQLKKYGDSTIRKLLTEEQYQNLQRTIEQIADIQKLDAALKSGVRPAEGSQTAYLLTNLFAPLALGPQAFVLNILGQGAGTSLYQRPFIQKFLGEGLQAAQRELTDSAGKPISKQAGVILETLSRMVGRATLSSQSLLDVEVDSGQEAVAGTQTPETDANSPQAGTLPLDRIESDLEKTMPPSTVNPFGGKSKREIMALALSQGASKADLEEIAGIYDLLAPDQAELSETQQKIAGDLRGEYAARTKENGYVDVLNSYKKLNSTPDTAAGDLSMIFAYMKMLDPGSVVRETEQDLAANATNLPGQLQNYALRVANGKKLNEKQRQEFRDAAEALFGQYQSTQQQIDDYYTWLSGQYGVDKKLVGVGMYGESAQPKQGGAQPRSDAGGTSNTANTPSTDEANLLSDLLFKANKAIVGEVFAAEDIDEMKNADLSNPSVLRRLEDLVRGFFTKKNPLSPEGTKASNKKATVQSDAPYRLEFTQDGKEMIIFPTGTEAVVENEREKAQQLAAWQELYPRLTGKEWPNDAPNWVAAVEQMNESEPQVLGTQTQTADSSLSGTTTQSKPSATQTSAAPTTSGRLVTTSDFDETIEKTWKGVDKSLVNTVIKGESGFRPNMVNINGTGGGPRSIRSREELNDILRKHKSVDIGLMQINTAPAVESYLKSQGLDWYDLLDPETNLRVAHALYSGKIPYTAPGWQNWHAIKNNNLQKEFGL